MTDKTFEMTMLFDFFGDLLTEKQREYFDMRYNEDLSLSEIAEMAGISRQGVRDIIVRAERLLTDTEEKTGVVRRFNEMREGILSLESDARQIREIDKSGEIAEIASKMIDKLQGLKG